MLVNGKVRNQYKVNKEMMNKLLIFIVKNKN